MSDVAYLYWTAVWVPAAVLGGMLIALRPKLVKEFLVDLAKTIDRKLRG